MRRRIEEEEEENAEEKVGDCSLLFLSPFVVPHHSFMGRRQTTEAEAEGERFQQGEKQLGVLLAEGGIFSVRASALGRGRRELSSPVWKKELFSSSSSSSRRVSSQPHEFSVESRERRTDTKHPSQQQQLCRRLLFGSSVLCPVEFELKKKKTTC